MQLPTTVNLQSSRSLALLQIAMHLAALLVLGNIELPLWIKLSSLLLIVISFWKCRHFWHSAQRVVLLTLRDKGVLEYLRANGETGEASVHPQSTVTSALTVILLKQERGMESLVLLPDALNPHDYRRLRLWLRWQSSASS